MVWRWILLSPLKLLIREPRASCIKIKLALCLHSNLCQPTSSGFCQARNFLQYASSSSSSSPPVISLSAYLSFFRSLFFCKDFFLFNFFLLFINFLLMTFVFGIGKIILIFDCISIHLYYLSLSLSLCLSVSLSLSLSLFALSPLCRFSVFPSFALFVVCVSTIY